MDTDGHPERTSPELQALARKALEDANRYAEIQERNELISGCGIILTVVIAFIAFSAVAIYKCLK